ncbi:ABC transporter ATP-binding protein [Paenibacillaceae sp. P-4]|uniref:ABC transporter ATP-binding protein n=1 Tax=Paenibacillaceae bacterium P-4 TaxID=3160969 RepID=UPI0032E8348C
MSNLLEVTNVNVQFEHFRLNNISFALQEGCITGFIGTNGSGKTTTIKAILGLIQKNAGSVSFLGKEMDKHERDLKNRIGIVFDEGYFYDDMTLSEMKSIIAPAYTNWDEAIFQRYIQRFNLQLNQKISTLSKGMRMKYAIALAMSHHADLLIMDEPTSGLDPLIRSELMELLLEFMNEEGKSVFFSTHITSDLEKIADTLLMIDHGDILFHEDKDALLDSHALVKGDKKLLNERTESLFLSLQVTAYGFEGITRSIPKVRQLMGNVHMEKPSIESIMLAYIGGNRHAH